MVSLSERTGLFCCSGLKHKLMNIDTLILYRHNFVVHPVLHIDMIKMIKMITHLMTEILSFSAEEYLKSGSGAVVSGVT